MMRQNWIDKGDDVAVSRQCVLAGVARAMWPPEPTCMNSAGFKLRTGFAALAARLRVFLA